MALSGFLLASSSPASAARPPAFLVAQELQLRFWPGHGGCFFFCLIPEILLMSWSVGFFVFFFQPYVYGLQIFSFWCLSHTAMPIFTPLGRDKTSRGAAFWSSWNWKTSHIPYLERDTDFLVHGMKRANLHFGILKGKGGFVELKLTWKRREKFEVFLLCAITSSLTQPLNFKLHVSGNSCGCYDVDIWWEI